MKIKLTPEEQQSIKIRETLILQKKNELIILEREKLFFNHELLTKKGLDPNKKYEFIGKYLKIKE